MSRSEIQRIGVLTSGGDAPGMNAGIRAIVRSGINYGKEVIGIYEGYKGLINGQFEELKSHSVSNIIQRGGTILRSARSQEFRKKSGMKKAAQQLKSENIDALIVIGGDGTFRGAKELQNYYYLPVIGIPGTIDNDLYGTDFAIGYDTAINTAVDAIDKIRDTADSHHRLFFIEVMGNDSGFIALRSGIAGGAEYILIPESRSDIEQLIGTLEEGWKRQKQSMIVLVAEGEEPGTAFEVEKTVNKRFHEYETRVMILGHIQRGGSPTCMDRVLASRLGVSAVKGLLEGEKDVMVGMQHHETAFTPLQKASKHHKNVDRELMNLGQILAQ